MRQVDSIQEAVRVIRIFDSLSVERRVEIFRSLSAPAREQLISSVLRPGEIMRMISPEEIYFTVKKLGMSDAPGLIAATTGQQLIYLLDIELWKKNMFSTLATARWLDIIASIGEEKMLQFLQTADPELIVTAMSRFLRVQVRNPDLDLVEQLDFLPPYTLDDMFFIDFRLPHHEETIKSLLEALFHWNVDYYFGLMEELATGIPSENEEMAGRRRRSRLADRGFPEFDEAVEIYRYLERSAVVDRAQELFTDFPHDDVEDFRPSLWYPLKVLEQETLFRRCLNEISETTESDRLSTELAHLANKVMVADGRDPGSLEELEGSLKKVGGYINIALEEICGDDLPRAARMVRSNHVEILFRRGFSIIMDLRKEIHQLLRHYEGGVENLGYPLAGLAQGLLQKRPYYAENVLGEKRSREFETLDDIRNIRSTIDRLSLDETWEPI
jgi:hypothetical protein